MKPPPVVNAQNYARLVLNGQRDGATLPMTCDAKGLLRLTLLFFRGRLAPGDHEFLGRAMLVYGEACIAEANEADFDSIPSPVR